MLTSMLCKNAITSMKVNERHISMHLLTQNSILEGGFFIAIAVKRTGGEHEEKSLGWNYHPGPRDNPCGNRSVL